MVLVINNHNNSNNNNSKHFETFSTLATTRPAACAQVLHLYETFGWWRSPELRAVHAVRRSNQGEGSGLDARVRREISPQCRATDLRYHCLLGAT